MKNYILKHKEYILAALLSFSFVVSGTAYANSHYYSNSSSDDGTSILIGLGLLIVLFGGIYILPTMIAVLRSHPQSCSIAALNIFLGWSIFGWVASLVWSLENYRTPGDDRNNPFYTRRS